MSEAAQVSPTRGVVLTVCTTNVCRSPLAAIELAEALRPTAFREVEVLSAGVLAEEGARMCESARTALADPSRGDAHRARTLSRQLIEHADLVLTMEKEQRSAGARLAPGHQHKLYTLREAERLIEVIASDAGAPPPRSVAELADRMRSLRGLVHAPAPRRRDRWFRRELAADDGLTIGDGHVRGPGEHRASVKTVRAVSVRLGASLAAISGPGAG